MQTNRVLFSLIVLALVMVSAIAFLDSPTPTLAQSVGPTPTATSTEVATMTATATGTVTATATTTATVTATATTTSTVTATATTTVVVAATATATATGTPASRDTYLSLIRRAPSSPTPTATPTATPTFTPSPTPEPSCNAYFDDFSNPSSGWATGENEDIIVQYINGEYSIATKQSAGYVFRSPANSYDDYSVEVDTRWNGTLGDSFGLSYGITSNFSSFYVLDFNTEVQAYRLTRTDGNNSTDIIPITTSGAILQGNAVNHVKITVSGDTHTIEFNGTVVNTVNAPHNGALDTGLVLASNSDRPVVDGRFDNFCVTVAQGTEGVNTKPVDAPTMKAITIPAWTE